MAFRQDAAVQKVAAAFAGLLAGCMASQDVWTVTAEPRLVRLDRFNLLAPCVAMHDPADRWLLNPKRAALFVDFMTGRNEERMRWGRRKYLENGLRQHWLVDLRQGYMEIGRPGVEIFFRYPAGHEIPIVVDEVCYGTFKPQDLFTTG